MTSNVFTSEASSSKRAVSLTSSGLRRVLGTWLLPWWVVLSLCMGTGTARAAFSAVVTFTNFPAAVSNTYNGLITLQINGMTNGVTNVLVQKFLDVNTNGAIDSHDLLVQEFQLTAGQAPTFMNGSTAVTVTNFMPGDASTVPGQITTPLNFQNGDFAQNLVGRYLYKVSSPSGAFAPVTNRLTVTNSLFSSTLSGTVADANTSSNIPNALVLLLNAQSSGVIVQAGAVADNSGKFVLSFAPGNYLITGAQSNYVGNLSTEVAMLPNSTNSGGTLKLTPFTTNITGKVVNYTNKTLGLPGLSGIALSTNSGFSLYFSGTNGNFTAPVVSDEWAAPVDTFAATFDGYLTWQTNQPLIVSNKAVTITNALPRATAIFYGVVTNNSGGPMPGVYLFAIDNAGHQSEGMTDARGNYVLDALGGTNLWQMGIVWPDNPGFTNNEVVAPLDLQTNISAGQAIQQNFVVASAHDTISGTVKDADNNPISGITVFATATNNGVVYQAFDATTDSGGNYSLNVSDGITWTVGLDTNSLASHGYTIFPANQSTNLSDANAVINFTILVCGEIQILTTNLPDATLGVPYSSTLLASSCQNISNWATTYGITLTALYDSTNITYTAGTPIYSTAGLQGYLLSDFSYGLHEIGGQWSSYSSNCTVTTSGGGGPQTVDFTSITATVNVSGPIASNTTVEFLGRTWKTTTPPSQQGNGIYQTTIFRKPNSPGDQYTIGDKPDAYVATNGMLMTGTAGAKTNLEGSLAGNFLSLAAGNSLNFGSTIAYGGTNGATVWIKHGTNFWAEFLISSYGPPSTNTPPGLTLFPDGTLSGTPSSLGTNNGVFNFTVAATDTDTNSAVVELTLVVLPATNSPALEPSGFMSSSNVFQMQVNGAVPGESYTLLMATNLAPANWVPIFTNAATTNSFLIPDVHATNPARFYRIQMSP